MKFLIEIQTFSFKKMNSKMSSAKSRPFCLLINYFLQHNAATANLATTGSLLPCAFLTHYSYFSILKNFTCKVNMAIWFAVP